MLTSGARRAQRADTLRFGILGCGVIGPHHARAIAGLDSAQLVAAADADPGRARKLAGEHGCAPFPSLEDMLSGADLDAVCVCTPSGLHAGDAIAALEAGKHVVIEKPVDVTLEAADRLLEAQRATGRKVAVVSQHRFDAATLAVRDAISRGGFGRLTSGSAEVRWWRPQAYYDSGGWRGTRKLDGGGALINQSIHSIDLLQWLMGPVVEVTAYTGLLAHERIEVEDTATAILKFEGGALGTIVATTAAYPGLTARIAVHGDRGSAIIDDDELRYFHAGGGGDAHGAAGNQAGQVMERFGGGATGTGAGADPGSLSMAHRAQIQDFIEAVREGREPLVNVEEGRKPIAIIAAIYESALTGGPVRVEDQKGL
ncbi:oxidoreductase domain protein [uncultured Rubrobacteraceae bacterium]|uniref:Oxidoreductase domain protein n=1 Tax=uncultured Rubrobacteraceae bacterium TaxID=349277 RepID=A0A6J4Q8E1_9ACTN|nr:oxidoreductase domain protein [uncultured Rubrobacteraceae bacterium]